MDVKKIARLTVNGVVLLGISDLIWLYATGRALGITLVWEQMSDCDVADMVNKMNDMDRHRTRGKIQAFIARRVAKRMERAYNA